MRAGRNSVSAIGMMNLMMRGDEIARVVCLQLDVHLSKSVGHTGDRLFQREMSDAIP